MPTCTPFNLNHSILCKKTRMRSTNRCIISKQSACIGKVFRYILNTYRFKAFLHYAVVSSGFIAFSQLIERNVLIIVWRHQRIIRRVTTTHNQTFQFSRISNNAFITIMNVSFCHTLASIIVRCFCIYRYIKI